MQSLHRFLMFPSNLRSVCWQVIVLAVVLVATSASRADDDEVLDRYLDRLGLDDLRATHLHQVIDKLPAGDRQDQLARRLGDLYASRLMDTATDSQDYQSTVSRIEDLAARFPAVNTAALKLTLLQADYLRAEKLAHQWTRLHGSREALSESGQVLLVVAPQFNALSEQYREEVEKLSKECEDLEGDELVAKEKELIKSELLAARATYFAGWSNYYLGLARQAGNDETLGLKVARQHFRNFLALPEEEDGVEKDDYKKMRVGVGLEREFPCLALVGLGMCEAALGNVEASRACLHMLVEESNAVPRYRDQVDFWLLRGLLNAERFDDALKIAQQRVETLTNASQGKVLFCVTLIRSGFGKETTGTQQKLGPIGIHGLARLRQFDLLREAARKYGIDLTNETGFYLQWLNGEQLAAKANKTRQASDYQAAIDALQAALKQPEVETAVADAAQCRRLLGGCLYEMGKYEQAAKAFDQAFQGLKSVNQRDAARSLWMACVSYRQLAKKQPRWSNTAIERLETLKDEFPQSQYARNVDYEIAKVRRGNVTLEQSIQQLEAIAPDDPSYHAARFDLCALRYEIWVRNKKAPGKFSQDLQQAVGQYLEFTKGSPDERRTRAALWGIDAILANQQPDLEAATALMERVKNSSEALELGSSVRHDYRYRALQIALKSGDRAGLKRHALWLADHAASSDYAPYALTVLAKTSELAVQEEKDEDKLKRLHLEAREIFERLVRLLGESAEQIRGSKNALVANSRLAHYDHQTGRFAKAAERLEKLLEAYPSNKKYLRRAGLAHYNDKQYERSLSHWRTLVSGLPSETDEWYEAKYYQMACLANIDPAKAAKVMGQFKKLHPEMGSAAWRKKIQQLDGSLSKSS